MTTEATAAEPSDETVTDEPAPIRRKRWWPWAVLSTAALTGVASVAVWMAVHSSPEATGRTKLQAAQLALINATGVHYIGRFPAANGENLSFDLRVTNVGDMSGTIEFEPGKPLSYLRIGDMAFLQGSADAWIAGGLSETDAANAEGKQLLQSSKLRGIDFAASLTPAKLGSLLDPNAKDNTPVETGAPITVDGHRSIPLVSGEMTTYVNAGRVDRIVHPYLDVQVWQMSSEEVTQFYRDLRPTVTALDVARDSGSWVSSDGTWSNPCAPTCTLTSTVTSTANPFAETVPGAPSPADTIALSYRTVLTIDGVVTTPPDCSGVTEMPGIGTTTLSCTFLRNAGSEFSATLSTEAVIGRTRADILLQTLDDNATKSRNKSGCPIILVEYKVTRSKSSC
ncbi:hypothetical protein [Nocardia huaxiensis]|uniref:hypothetical protein n=1 Tax=Nocardia huaxiensis TaxID=2755382 RepID=UPI001E532704|nr:hypothetical protein [Nocardia huaxiensis]UFS95551.1 hypothetical protein LPY97_33575 [Nocardia huaxiensis]